jgi:hypothetical protein
MIEEVVEIDPEIAVELERWRRGRHEQRDREQERVEKRHAAEVIASWRAVA